MDRPDTQNAVETPAVSEAAYYSAQDSVMRKVREDELAEKEAAQSDAPDSTKFAMEMPAADKTNITSTAVTSVNLPDKSNAEINAMLHQLSKSRGNVAITPPPVTCVVSHDEYRADGSLLLLRIH